MKIKSIALFVLAFVISALFVSCSEPHQHEFGEWITDTEANCVDSGTQKRSCECGAVETETVSAMGHNFLDGVCKRCKKGASDGLEFLSNGDETCTFIGRGTCTDADIIFPAKSPSGEVLTKIMGGRFFGDELLTSVYIPEGIIEIPTDAFFAAPNLAAINVSRGNTVFASCDGVLYSKDLKTLVEYPEAKLGTTFDIPVGTTAIGVGAFDGANKLTDISIPEGVHTIGMSAFRSCSALTSITIPEGVTTIAGATFTNCRSLSHVSLPESVTTIEENAFGYCESLTSFTVPSGVTTIPKYAFSNCKSLADIKLHDKITTIGPSAFYYCSALKEINVPASVTRIYERAFASCASLESVVIPDGVKTVYAGTFQLCSSLVSITIPESVTKIEDSAFYECKALSSIIFKGTVAQWESVKTIGNWRAFAPAKEITCADGAVKFSFSYS